jgi:hypothetical protein
MTATVIKDQVQQGKDRLVTQWFDKPVVQGLLKSYMENVQTVEDTYEQLLDERSVFTAVGEQLNVIGTIVGEARNGKADDPYREAILNRIAINTSDSTPEKIMQIMRTVTGGNFINITEHHPASFHLFVDKASANAVATTLKNIAGAGISTRLMFDDGNIGFVAGEATLIEPFLILDDDGNMVLATATVADGNLITSELQQTSFANSFLPDTIDTEIINPLCEVIDQTQYDTLTGFLLDELGNFIVDDEGNNIRWTQVEVRT